MNNPTSESQIELCNRDWPGNGHMSSWVDTGKQENLSSEAENVLIDGRGNEIHVTNGVTVTRETVDDKPQQTY